MNEPKRRGRPPKAALVTPIDGLGNGIANYPTPVAGAVDVLAAQAFALRVWNGQSRDLPRRVRIERVKSALERQNLPFEGVQLP